MHTELVHDIQGDTNLEYRVADAARRIAERAYALSEKVAKHRNEPSQAEGLSNRLELKKASQNRMTNKETPFQCLIYVFIQQVINLK